MENLFNMKHKLTPAMTTITTVAHIMENMEQDHTKEYEYGRSIALWLLLVYIQVYPGSKIVREGRLTIN